MYGVLTEITPTGRKYLLVLDSEDVVIGFIQGVNNI